MGVPRTNERRTKKSQGSQVYILFVDRFINKYLFLFFDRRYHLDSLSRDNPYSMPAVIFSRRLAACSYSVLISTLQYIDVIRFEMSSDEEKTGYIKLYSYFYSRNRVGVVGNCYSGVKDMYILPLASHDPIPEELKPLPGKSCLRFPLGKMKIRSRDGYEKFFSRW